MSPENPLGIAFLSFAHVHSRGYADQIMAHSGCRIVSVWDEEPLRGHTEADRLGVPFHEDISIVLADPDVVGVVCCAPTSMHAELLVAAAQAGKHLFVEKPLATTTAAATEVMRAVEDANVRFMIAMPSRSRPEILFARKVIDQGLLGDVTQVRARIAHMAALDNWYSGSADWYTREEKSGGGAFFDLGAHRADLMLWLMGEPVSAAAQMTNFSGGYDIDDSMAAAITFHSKAIGIIDVSWVHRYGPNPLEIFGTEGYLGIDACPGGPRVQMISKRLTSHEIEGYIAPTNLPAGLPSPLAQWISAIDVNSPLTVSIYDAYNAVRLLEGCYTAAREGREFVF